MLIPVLLSEVDRPRAESAFVPTESSRAWFAGIEREIWQIGNEADKEAADHEENRIRDRDRARELTQSEYKMSSRVTIIA